MIDEGKIKELLKQSQDKLDELDRSQKTRIVFDVNQACVEKLTDLKGDRVITDSMLVKEWLYDQLEIKDTDLTLAEKNALKRRQNKLLRDLNNLQAFLDDIEGREVKRSPLNTPSNPMLQDDDDDVM